MIIRLVSTENGYMLLFDSINLHITSLFMNLLLLMMAIQEVEKMNAHTVFSFRKIT